MALENRVAFEYQAKNRYFDCTQKLYTGVDHYVVTNGMLMGPPFNFSVKIIKRYYVLSSMHLRLHVFISGSLLNSASENQGFQSKPSNTDPTLYNFLMILGDDKHIAIFKIYFYTLRLCRQYYECIFENYFW